MDETKVIEDDREYEVRPGDVKWVGKDDLEEMALRAHSAPSVEDAYRHRGNRIEALRAASRIVAGVYSSLDGYILDKEGKPDTTQGATLFLAKQFAKYLEGE